MKKSNDDTNDLRWPEIDKAAVMDPDYADSRIERGYSGAYPGRETFAEPEEGLADHLAVLFARKWTALIVFVLIFSLACFYTFTRTPIYKSEATLEIGSESKDTIKTVGESIAPAFGAMAQRDLFATEAEILRSRSLTEALILKMKLQEDPRFAPPAPNLWVRLVSFVTSYFAERSRPESEAMSQQRIKNEMITEVQARLSVAPVGESRLMRLGMMDKDPDFARDMLRNLVGLYIEQNFRKRIEGNEEVSQWLKEEMEKTELALRGSVEALVKFTNEHGIVSLDEGSNHLMKFFDKAADDLVKSKEQTLGLEAAAKSPNPVGLTFLGQDTRGSELEKMEEKLAILETEYAQKAEVYSDSFPTLRLLDKRIKYLRDKIDEKKNALTSAALQRAKIQESMRQKAFEHAKKEAMGVNSIGVQYAVLLKEKETNEQIYKILLQKTKEIDLNTKIIGNNVRLVDSPTLPLRPTKPKKGLLLLAGIILGMVGGVLGAFIRNQMDNTVKSTAEVEKLIHVPSLGMTPDVNKVRKRAALIGHVKNMDLVVHEAPRSPVAEGIRHIKTSILLSAPANSVRTLVVSSAGPADGKTFISISLATAFADGNKKVLLVDADLRRPRVSKAFGHKSSSVGLSTALSGNGVRLPKVVRRTDVPGLYYVPAGPASPNPVGLIESDRMARILAQFRRAFDYVIIDTPPIIGFADTRILAARSDGLVLVARKGHVTYEALKVSANLIQSARGKILGFVLNMVEEGPAYYGGYKYYKMYDKYYGSRSEGGK